MLAATRAKQARLRARAAQRMAQPWDHARDEVHRKLERSNDAIESFPKLLAAVRNPDATNSMVRSFT